MNVCVECVSVCVFRCFPSAPRLNFSLFVSHFGYIFPQALTAVHTRMLSILLARDGLNQPTLNASQYYVLESLSEDNVIPVIAYNSLARTRHEVRVATQVFLSVLPALF